MFNIQLSWLLLCTCASLGAAMMDPSVWCQRCRAQLQNQLDYYAPDNETCPTYFYHCQHLGDHVFKATRRDCPLGHYWRQDLLLCLPFYKGGCNDPCRNQTIQTQGSYFDIDLGCNCYYACANYISIKMTCPLYTRFDDSQLSCVLDGTCGAEARVKCIGEVNSTSVTPTAQQLPDGACVDPFDANTQHRGIDGDRFFQTAVINTSFWFNQTCAPGSLWSQLQCFCQIGTTDLPAITADQPLLIIDFSNPGFKVIDRSLHEFYIYCVGNVKVGNKGYLHPNNLCEIPGFQHMDLGPTVTLQWTMGFDGTLTAGTHTVLSNYGDDGYSLQIYWSDNGTLFVDAIDGRQVAHRVSMAGLDASSDNSFVIRIADGRLELIRNCNFGSAVVELNFHNGLTWLQFCPWVLGWSAQYGFGASTIDNILFWRKYLDNDFLSNQGFC